MDVNPDNYPKILLRRFEAMGDILMITPIIRKLYNDRGGKCHIDFQLYEPHKIILEHNPFVRHVLGMNEPFPCEYDIVINLDLVYEKKPKIHAVDAFAELVFGTTNFDKSLDLFTSEVNKTTADHIKSMIGNDYIVLHVRNHPGTSRNININFWQGLVESLLSKTTVSIAFIGQQNEVCFFGNDRLIDLRHRFDILTIKEIIARAKLFVGSDTGTLHVAGTTNTDILGLFTSVRSEYRLPFRLRGKFIPIASDIDCYGCQEQFTPPVARIDCMRGDYECQNRFNPESVTEQILSLLN